ncbi:polyprenyl synthetase family protein [Thermosipho sp. 1070]|uniref:polyprenyl synthetase family protein n=1 Tax=Thermosipho sp. 1070 TaxID=1437364 RepID=UPI0009492682|nr:polyprenyl synthetase family protein [Thermosipho sp. 1070]ANQ54269.1 polyprenyl synthetase [Thermosipho sp. 1070]
MDFEVFRKVHVKYIEKNIEEVIDENKLTNSQDYLVDELKLFCLRSGKRIRPLLFLLGAESFGAKIDERIYKVSAVIEVMHSFLLIHDDIMDQSDKRRGLPSMHSLLYEKFKDLNFNPKIGENLALVLGDVLFFIALRALSKLELPNGFLKDFSECYINTGYGQILDVIYSMNKKYKEIFEEKKISLEISKLKTAYYTFFYPFYLGALFGKRNVPRGDLEGVLIPAGIAFQIRDDILSTFDENSGKSNLSDILEGKVTALIDFGKYDDNFFEMYFKPRKTDKEIGFIIDTIRKSGAVESAKIVMNELFELSLKNLEKIDIKNKEVLMDLILRLRRD